MTVEKLFDELRKQGIYVMFYTSVFEIKSLIHDATDDEIKLALEWLENEYSDEEDFHAALSMVRDRIEINRER
jgi:hypothetical protein